ncbi:hypothetical protein [Streptomyces melanogenes]|uniref:hypothetical protein n=1 Tax=Streptomyces melanogenes TaxID=67326 RepID=UPI00167D27B6|nr:hypothetical protein [Streptomyces melanogenes]
MAQDWTAVYLAHRETYAAFLTAVDAEARVAWRRGRGEYEDEQQALAAVDAAFTKTQASFNMIDLDAVGAAPAASALVEWIRAMHEASNETADAWEEFMQRRRAFVEAAREDLRVR